MESSIHIPLPLITLRTLFHNVLSKCLTIQWYHWLQPKNKYSIIHLEIYPSRLLLWELSIAVPHDTISAWRETEQNIVGGVDMSILATTSCKLPASSRPALILSHIFHTHFIVNYFCEGPNLWLDTSDSIWFRTTQVTDNLLYYDQSFSFH